MLKRLQIQDFTVFANADFEFSKGLNIIVGTNGTGKSHVLKLGYAVLKGLKGQFQNAMKSRGEEKKKSKTSIAPAQRIYNPFLGSILLDIFRPAPFQLEELVRRGSISNDAALIFETYDERLKAGSFTFDLDGHAAESPFVPRLTAQLVIPAEIINFIERDTASPVCIPAKEVLTLGWILPVSKQLVLPLDEIYLDLLTQLSGLPLQRPESAAKTAIQELTATLKGQVEEEGGRYYLAYPKQRRMEMTMVAEGLRKFGTLQKLLANGSLTSKATLFWDEPEANLNPALLRKLAAVLVKLSKQGFQIILATHSLFLLKEFHILSQTEKTPIRYFGLFEGPDGATQVETTDDFETLEHIAALDAELEQTVDFQQALDYDDAN